MDKVAPRYGYSYCEDSTSVLTIKRINHKKSKIEHSCDFAIVRQNSHNKQEYIFNDKFSRRCYWKQRPGIDFTVQEKADDLRYWDVWNELRDEYLCLKNLKYRYGKTSREIYAEVVDKVWQRQPGPKSCIIRFN